MKICGIYCIKGPRQRRYIGSSNDIYQRWRGHKSTLNRNKHSSKYLQNAWNKYSAEQFEFTILEVTKPEYLLEREKYYINLYDSCNKNKGFNTLEQPGSFIGFCHSEQTKQQISQSLTGIKRSKETKEKYRQRMLGYQPSIETRNKISKANSGHKYTEEHKAKISASLKQAYQEGKRVSWNKGKTMSQETKDKISAALKNKIKKEIRND